MHNLGEFEYVWNPCLRAVERRTDSGWGYVQEAEHFCTLEGWLLEPDDRTKATTGLPPSLPPESIGFATVFPGRSPMSWFVMNR